MYIACCKKGNLSTVNDEIFPKNYLFKLVSPDFIPRLMRNHLCLGQAIKYPKELIIGERKQLLKLGLKTKNRISQMASIVSSLGIGCSNLGENTVGGMIVVGAISDEDIEWLHYSSFDKFELTIENGKFIQYNHLKNKKIEIQTIFEFSSSQYSNSGLVFNTPVFENFYKNKNEGSMFHIRPYPVTLHL